MTLDTIATPIPHHVVPQIINRLDERGETYEFIVAGEDSNIRRTTPPLELVLHREGHADPLVLRLNMDGTWTAEYVLVIGEQR